METKKLQSHQNYKWFVLTNVAVGTFMATLDGSIVNVALPTIAKELHTNMNSLQWVVSAYLLTLSTLILIFGRIADMVGKSKVYSLGFLGFVLGSFLCVEASTVKLLVLARIVQALGSAMLMSNGMGIVTSVFPPQERGRALGMTGTVVAAGSLAGPSIGGFLVHSYGWHSIFLINLPIGLIGFLAAMYVLPKDNPAPKQKFDILGAILFAVSINSLMLGLAELQSIGPEKIYPLVLILLAIISSIIFIRHEKRTSEPMLDLSLFNNRLFSAGSLAGLLSFVAMFFTTILMPFYLQRIIGLDPDKAGLMLTPFPLAMAVIAPISGWLSDKLGPNKLTTSGMALLFIGLLAMSTLGATSPLWLIIVILLLQGIAMGLFQSPNNSSVMGTVPKPKLGIASGVNATVRNVGMALGVNLSITLFTFFYNGSIGKPLPEVIDKAKFIHGLHYVFIIASLAALAGMFISSVRSSNKIAENAN